MRSEIGLTEDVELWANKAGYSVTESSSDDGRAIIWNAGGEIRYYIGEGTDNWVVVTSSERMGEEQFEFASRLPALIERKFVAIFARLVRTRIGLARLPRRNGVDNIAPGYSIGALHFSGRDRRTLIDPQGKVIAVVGGGELVGTANAVELSIFATTTTEAIANSMMDADGRPLFSQA